jgi:purine-binding chemotaxis protein CheW
MSKNSPFARENIMEDYLDSLLMETDTPSEVALRTAKLLEQATLDNTLSERSEEDIHSEGADAAIDTASQVIESAIPEEPVAPIKAMKDELGQSFQALFFDVAGLTLAVPLISLGGIHKLDKISPLFGKPEWFKGVMLHRDEKINVVDSAMWVMPEKYDQNLLNKLNYQYLIMLDGSQWGLACDKLINTVTLDQNEVKWREPTGKRPWLAGMVKERMCALINVKQLIAMLNNGLGSNDQVP